MHVVGFSVVGLIVVFVTASASKVTVVWAEVNPLGVIFVAVVMSVVVTSVQLGNKLSILQEVDAKFGISKEQWPNCGCDMKFIAQVSRLAKQVTLSSGTDKHISPFVQCESATHVKKN